VKAAEALTPARREVLTVAGGFLYYGAVFFDRLAPLYIVGFVAHDLGVPSGAEGTLALVIGVCWAAAMPFVRRMSGRWNDRHRILVAGTVASAFHLASATAGGWAPLLVLRGLGGFASATSSPAVTAIVFAAAEPHRRGFDLGLVQSATRVLGSLVSPAAVTAVTVIGGWRAGVVTSALVLLVATVFFWLIVPSPARQTRQQRLQTAEFTLKDGGARNIALCTLSCVLLLSWLMIWSQSAVQVAQDWLAINADAAGRLAGLFGLGASTTAIAVPTASDRIGRRLALALAAVVGGFGGLAIGLFAAYGVVPPQPIVIATLVLSGVALGALPLVISIIPAEAVASGDVGRSLLWPIATGEVIGAAALPAVAAAAAVPFGRSTVVAATAVGVLALAPISRLLHPLETTP
jgi:MFS transporter, ACS family, hexuronate transporter